MSRCVQLCPTRCRHTSNNVPACTFAAEPLLEVAGFERSAEDNGNVHVKGTKSDPSCRVRETEWYVLVLPGTCRHPVSTRDSCQVRVAIPLKDAPPKPAASIGLDEVLVTTEKRQKSLLAGGTSSNHQFGFEMAEVSIGLHECPGGNQADPPEVLLAFEGPIAERTDVPSVTKHIDQVDSSGRLRIEIAEGEVAHPGTVS